jgi:hypothetical protein
MVSFLSLNRFSGIVEAQLGEPLADGVEGVLNDLNADRLVSAAFALADTTAEDEEVGELFLLDGDERQVGLVAVFAAEEGPGVPVFGLGAGGLGDESGCDGCKRRAEVSAESMGDLRRSCCQGVACGCVCDM